MGTYVLDEYDFDSLKEDVDDLRRIVTACREKMLLSDIVEDRLPPVMRLIQVLCALSDRTHGCKEKFNHLVFQDNRCIYTDGHIAIVIHTACLQVVSAGAYKSQDVRGIRYLSELEDKDAIEPEDIEYPDMLAILAKMKTEEPSYPSLLELSFNPSYFSVIWQLAEALFGDRTPRTNLIFPGKDKNLFFKMASNGVSVEGAVMRVVVRA